MDRNSSFIGTYQREAFPTFRNPTMDILIWGSKRHHVPVLLEVDVTEARSLIREQKAKTREGISFTGWMVKCLAQAISEHKYMQAIRQGNRLVLFNDVDVTIVVERAVGPGYETLPMPYIIRRANEKTVLEIHAEIRTAQKLSIPTGEVQIGSNRPVWMTRIALGVPRLIRDLLIWRPLLSSPFKIKQTMGTVAVTAIGMIGHGAVRWAVPIGIHPLIIAVGGTIRRLEMIDEQISIREYLGLTVMFDHDVTDGAPVARFIGRLNELIECSFGLKEALK